MIPPRHICLWYDNYTKKERFLLVYFCSFELLIAPYTNLFMFILSPATGLITAWCCILWDLAEKNKEYHLPPSPLFITIIEELTVCLAPGVKSDYPFILLVMWKSVPVPSSTNWMPCQTTTLFFIFFPLFFPSWLWHENKISCIALPFVKNVCRAINSVTAPIVANMLPTHEFLFKYF